jgi:hypothetical protein
MGFPDESGSSEPDPPAAGTKCFPCWLAGHYCRATTWWFEVAVCATCLESKPCAQQLAVHERLYAAAGSDWMEAGHMGERERWRA